MIFRIDVLKRLPCGQSPNPDTPIEMVLFRWGDEDVLQATRNYLLERYWVRVVDSVSGRTVSGPFDPTKVLPRRSAILPHLAEYEMDWLKLHPAVWAMAFVQQNIQVFGGSLRGHFQG